MTTATRPADLPDDALSAAERHHQTLGDAYLRMAGAASTEPLRAAQAKLAATHHASAQACRNEAQRRRIEG